MLLCTWLFNNIHIFLKDIFDLLICGGNSPCKNKAAGTFKPLWTIFVLQIKETKTGTISLLFNDGTTPQPGRGIREPVPHLRHVAGWRPAVHAHARSAAPSATRHESCNCDSRPATAHRSHGT